MSSSDRNVKIFPFLVTLFTCVIFLNQAMAALPIAKTGAHFESRIAKIIDKAKQKPDYRETAVTVIYEDDFNAKEAELLKKLGGKRRFSTPKGLHELVLPAGKLQALQQGLPDSGLLRLSYPHAAAEVISQGVAFTGALDMQTLGHGGAGVTIGIIDLGFASLATSQAAGELPTDLIITDYTGTGTGGINHGTNVAEIVHDMAPQAHLLLAKIGTDVQLQQALTDMIAAGVDVINHSVGWYGAGYYDGTGPICAITDSAAAYGILWVNANGNDRNRHYSTTFTDADGDLRHDFAPGQDYNTITVNAGAKPYLILNWNDYGGRATTINYNLYLYDGNPELPGSNMVASSETIQAASNKNQPYEVINNYTAPITGTYYIVVKKFDASQVAVPLTLFSLSHDLITKTYASSIAQPADGFNVLGVGAANLSDVAEWFSSEGPTTDGRQKPEITGPDGTKTSLSAAFYGTSGAAPHVAGAAALLLSQNPGLAPAQLKTALIQTAKDINTAGFDYRTGNGRFSLDADLDGLNHDQDNCLLDANPDQLDTDLDNIGNICDPDDDNDGLADLLEIQIGTDPLLVDTDGDGLSDYFEVAFDGNVGAYTAGVDLNPLSADTDGDTLSDYYELAYGGNPGVYNPGLDLNPLSNDTDGDGFPDNTDPLPSKFNYCDGDIAPLGNPDGMVNAADYALALRILSGDLASSDLELTHGDLYPPGNPDGIINLSDVVLLLKLLH